MYDMAKEMKTGIVMEINGNKATLLAAGGEFVAVKAQAGWQKGQVVAFAPRPKAVHFAKRWVAVAACLLVLFSAAAGAVWLSATPASIISIDINPSIELSVNRFGTVVGFTAYNQDGDQLLQSVHIKGENYQQALQTLLQSSVMEALLAQDNFLAFTVYSPRNQEEMVAYMRQLSAALQSSHPQMQVACNGVGVQTLEQAHHNGMTSGKWIALQELQQVDPTADIESYNDCGIAEIYNRTQECHSAQAASGQQGQGQAGQNGGAHHGSSSSAAPPPSVAPPSSTAPPSSAAPPASSQPASSSEESTSTSHGHGHGHGH